MKLDGFFMHYRMISNIMYDISHKKATYRNRRLNTKLINYNENNAMQI